MRTKTISRWRKAVLGVAALTMVGGARAQDTTPPAADPAPAPETAKIPAANAPAAEGGEAQTYTIQKGDTLWDLSQKFLNNPWYWPKIWTLNPYIENPHWIYPGNKLKVRGGVGGAPAQVEGQAAPVAADGTQAPAGGEQAAADPNAAAPGDPNAADPNAAPADDPLATVPTADPNSVAMTEAEKAAADRVVSTSGRIAFVPPAVMTTRVGTLVTDQEVDAAGSLDSSFAEKEMLSMYDTGYVRFKQDGLARVGDKLSIFRPGEDVRSPSTGARLARRMTNVADAKVIATNGSMATIQIGNCYGEIQRGDLVKPWTDTRKRLAPKPNSKQITGSLIGPAVGAGDIFGTLSAVLIDKGSADGVEEGNTFEVVRKGDGLAGVGNETTRVAGETVEGVNRIDHPDEAVGLIMVVEVKDNISTAIIVRSIRELAAGERVEMKPGGSGGD